MSDDLDAQRPVIVTMPQEIDAGNASEVGLTLEAAFALGAPVVVADCTPTKFCDSIGFNTLLLTNQKVREANAELLFVITAESQLRRVLKLLEMQDALAVYPSIGAAVAASRQLPLPSPGRPTRDRAAPSSRPGPVLAGAFSCLTRRSSKDFGRCSTAWSPPECRSPDSLAARSFPAASSALRSPLSRVTVAAPASRF